jgi:uncharacterized protein YdhG (YjbR/CyaY superfamily)
MAKTDFTSVDEYIATQPRRTESVLTKLRRVLRKALPKAEEGISYQIPTYKLGGRAAIYFAGFEEHVSLYPASAAVLRALGETAKKHLSGRATLRFALDEPLPVQLIERAAKARALELTAMLTSKPRSAKPRAKTRTKTTVKVKSRASKSRAKTKAKPRRKAADPRRRER